MHICVFSYTERKYNFLIIHIQPDKSERGKAPMVDRSKAPTVGTLAHLQQLTEHAFYYI